MLFKKTSKYFLFSITNSSEYILGTVNTDFSIF